MKVNWSLALVGEVPAGRGDGHVHRARRPAGEVAVIWVSETTVKVAAAVPKSTAVAPVKSVPVMVTEVPPAVGPAFGLTEVTVGAATKVNWSAEAVGEVPPGVVTVMSTVPGRVGGRGGGDLRCRSRR